MSGNIIGLNFGKADIHPSLSVNQTSPLDMSSNTTQKTGESIIIPLLKKPPTSSKNSNIFMLIHKTKYPSVRFVGSKMMKFKLVYKENSEWDICWQDTEVTAEQLKKMKPFQKVNHFPGMYLISRKSNLCTHLMRMRHTFHKDYDFFPKTWYLPFDLNSLLIHSQKGIDKVYISKPHSSCQGRGIIISKKVSDFIEKERVVVQTYIDNPLLIEGLKFDLRIYILLSCSDPLRIYMYEEGMARLCTEKYCEPKHSNIKNQFMHLTNYAINKLSEKFVYNQEADNPTIGHKRSLTYILKEVEKLGGNSTLILNLIEDAVIKTLISIQPSLSHLYNACQPEDIDGGCCFEVLGFDFLIDKNFKPFLLEVNHTPSFTTDTPFDKKLKRELIFDTLKLIKISRKHKKNYEVAKKNSLKKRTVSTPQRKISFSDKIKKRNKKINSKIQYEQQHLGKFKLIYPTKTNIPYYEKYFAESTRLWNVFTSGTEYFPDEGEEEGPKQYNNIIGEKLYTPLFSYSGQKKIDKNNLSNIYSNSNSNHNRGKTSLYCPQLEKSVNSSFVSGGRKFESLKEASCYDDASKIIPQTNFDPKAKYSSDQVTLIKNLQNPCIWISSFKFEDNKSKKGVQECETPNLNSKGTYSPTESKNKIPEIKATPPKIQNAVRINKILNVRQKKGFSVKLVEFPLNAMEEPLITTTLRLQEI